MLAAPLGERSLFVTGPGPASGGSKPGKDSRAQMPEKSGIDAAPSAAPLAGPASEPVVCAKAGTAAVSSAAVTRVDRVFMITLLSSTSWGACRLDRTLAASHIGHASCDQPPRRRSVEEAGHDIECARRYHAMHAGRGPPREPAVDRLEARGHRSRHSGR